jgi:signal transduction histidine kinase
MVPPVEHRTGDYLRELAHEVGNALHPIHLIVQVLGQPNLDAAMIQRLRQGLEAQMPALDRLISDLRRVSLIARDSVEWRPQTIDATTLLRHAAERLRPRLEDSGVSLDVRITDDLPQLRADADLLEKMVEELLVNAARHTPPGGHITLSAMAAENEVVVCVADNGEGISAELLPHVFELFVRGESAGPGHFGVGLTFVRQVAQKHGGCATAESRGPGQGAAFTIRLPIPDGARMTSPG